MKGLGHAGDTGGSGDRVGLRHHRKSETALALGAWIGRILIALLVTAVLSFVLYATYQMLVSSAAPNAEHLVSPLVRKAGFIASALVDIICVGSGGFGFLWMVHELGRRSNMLFNKALLGLSTAMTVALVIFAGFALGWVGLGEWMVDLDRWSRSKGYADAGVTTLFSLSCLWPYAGIGLNRIVRGKLFLTDIVTEPPRVNDQPS